MKINDVTFIILAIALLLNSVGDIVGRSNIRAALAALESDSKGIEICEVHSTCGCEKVDETLSQGLTTAIPE